MIILWHTFTPTLISFLLKEETEIFLNIRDCLTDIDYCWYDHADAIAYEYGELLLCISGKGMETNEVMKFVRAARGIEPIHIFTSDNINNVINLYNNTHLK